MDITLDEFIKQWLPGNDRKFMGSKLAMNIVDFTTQTGDYSKRYFEECFSKQGFDSKPWAPRKPRKNDDGHPLLKDTGELSSSLKNTNKKIDYDSKRDNGSRLYHKGAIYQIYTTEENKTVVGKRIRNVNALGYAAIHNSNPNQTDYRVNKHSKVRPIQRQFIGFSNSLENYIQIHFIPTIFKDFPC